MIYNIFHMSDLDGHCSGAIARYYFEKRMGFKLNTDFKMIPLNYGEKFDESIINKNEDEVYFLDFTFQPPERMINLIKNGYRIKIIDHHASSYEYLSKIKFLYMYSDKESACSLAFKHFFPDKKLPRFIKILSDYDIFNREDAEYFQNVVLPFQYAMRTENTCPSDDDGYYFWESLLNNYFMKTSYDYEEFYIENKIKEGKPIMKYLDISNKKNVEKYMFKFVWKVEDREYKVVACNSNNFSSQFFSSLEPNGFDIMMSFCNVRNKFYTVSIYTDKEDVNCAHIAKLNGGGGHKQASGFQVDDIYKIIPPTKR